MKKPFGFMKSYYWQENVLGNGIALGNGGGVGDAKLQEA
jgi:hypothetical protein